MNRDAKFINFSEEHELDYILKKYGKKTSAATIGTTAAR